MEVVDAECSYYGHMDDELLGDNASYYAVDQVWVRMLERQEEMLKKSQNKMIVELRKTFSEDIKDFNSKIAKLNKRIDDLMKEKQNAIEKVNEQKSIQRKHKA